MSGPTVAEPAPRTQRRGRRAPHVGYPMCTHAYVASAFGASRLHGLLADWPRSYAEAILRTARPGWETAGAAPKRRACQQRVGNPMWLCSLPRCFLARRAEKPHTRHTGLCSHHPESRASS
mmetsp:Transcript_41920/g.135984  ORF Transcript_41920/g.135984 Transcript_41920/m.135984 type:complete len:121 (-) Transcript_41920:389-751(-)